MLLVVLGFWTHRAVEGSLREIRAGSMRNLLGSQVNALRVWIAEETGDAERIAREPRVGAAIAALAADPQCSGAARGALEDMLRPLLRDVGDATFNVVTPEGRLIATRFPEYCGRRATAEFMAELAPVLAGQARFVRPFRDEWRVEGAPRLRAGPPFAWVATPVRDAGGRVVAALSIAEPVDAVFASILLAARPGASGEAFAFDAKGGMLSGESFGERTRLPVAGGAEDGAVLDPYVNHRGAGVIGAWRWLPEIGMGVAIEIEAAEAYAPMRYLNIAFSVVFGALVLAVLAALGTAGSFLRLRRELGSRVGPYRLLERIGEGGMADVHLARHDLLRRPAAVKILKSTHASDEMVARFQREAQLASSLVHPNTVEVFDYGRTRDGHFYYAMEYLDGLTVGQVLQRDKWLPAARVIHVLRQVCAALAEAHAKGLVHRDIKPENIMMCRYGGEYDFAKILDFGLVKQLAAEHSRDLTRGLRILGTPLYMAPERLRDPADVDGRADLYAVGAVAWYMLAGRRMFEVGEDLAITSKVLNEEPPRIAAVAPQPIPVELDLLVTACLEKNRENRPQSAAGVVEALDALAAEHRWTQRDAQAWWEKLSP